MYSWKGGIVKQNFFHYPTFLQSNKQAKLHKLQITAELQITAHKVTNT